MSDYKLISLDPVSVRNMWSKLLKISKFSYTFYKLSQKLLRKNELVFLLYCVQKHGHQKSLQVQDIGAQNKNKKSFIMFFPEKITDTFSNFIQQKFSLGKSRPSIATMVLAADSN